MHTFLTGEIRVGKTTIIRKLISRAHLSACGFLTYWDTADSGERAVFLSPYSTDVKNADRFCLARAAEEGLVREPNITEVFNYHGAGILRNCGRCDVIVMDELGFLESGAMMFQKAVIRQIDGDVPILGVIKPRQTEFLDAVREHPKTNIYEVTEYNRDDILRQLMHKRGRI